MVDDAEHAESILRRALELCGEVLPGVSRRRIWSTEEKLRILAQSSPGFITIADRSERRQPVRRPLPKHLPRKEIIRAPAEICPGCGGTHFSRLGEDFTEVLEKIPARQTQILLPHLRNHHPGPGAWPADRTQPPRRRPHRQCRGLKISRWAARTRYHLDTNDKAVRYLPDTHWVPQPIPRQWLAPHGPNRQARKLKSRPGGCPRPLSGGASARRVWL